MNVGSTCLKAAALWAWTVIALAMACSSDQQPVEGGGATIMSESETHNPALTRAVTTASASALDADPVSSSMAQENEIQELTQRYTAVARKAPTRFNLLQSIDVQNAHGESAAEMIAAIELLALTRKSDGSLASDIQRCLAANATNWVVQVTGAKAILMIDKQEGLRLSRTLLATPEMNLEAKLLLATHMLKAGVVDGYAVLREGLRSDKPIEKQLTRGLLEAFREHEGHQVPSTGETIRVDELLRDTASETSGAELREKESR